jgi:hypothetical protein
VTAPQAPAPVVAAAPVATTPVGAVDQDEAAVPTQHTKDDPLGAARMSLAGALALGIPSLAAGPLLTRRGRKLALLDL